MQSSFHLLRLLAGGRTNSRIAALNNKEFKCPTQCQVVIRTTFSRSHSCCSVIPAGNLVIARTGIVKSNFRFVGSVTKLDPEIGKEEVDAAVAEEQAQSVGSFDKSAEQPTRNLEKDRTKVIPVETSIRYLSSDAYKQSYGGQPIWTLYRRNFKGQFAPKRTRKTCIRSDMITTGNPCPICRDEFLVLDYRNVELLKQFLSPFNGEILSSSKTGLCQMRHLQLLVAIVKAKDYGTITFDVPLRVYDYSDYDFFSDSLDKHQ